jgi:hypothetical protein
MRLHRPKVIAVFLILCLYIPTFAWQKQTSLFTGRDLQGWQITGFHKRGNVTVTDSSIILARGHPMTGIHREEPLPVRSYEIELDAKRMSGIDYFCGITFPVGDSYCSLIVGGWGGEIVGLSSIDGQDASQNDTMRFKRFDTGYWYHIRLRVTDTAIQAWIDGKKMVDFAIVEHVLSLREGVLPSRPFGITSWRTTAALRNIRLKEIVTLGD